MVSQDQNPCVPDSTLIEKIASALSDFEQDDGQESAQEILDKIAIARESSSGAIDELLWATENFLCTVIAKPDELPTERFEVLQDVSRSLHTTITETSKPINSELIDELLERLDFLASGGTDGEVPRRATAHSTPPTTFDRIRFPVPPTAGVEDPALAGLLIRGASIGKLLETRSATETQTLVAHQVRLFNDFSLCFDSDHCEPIETLFATLETRAEQHEKNPDVNESLELRRVSSPNSLYKSLLKYLKPSFDEFILALLAGAENSSKAKLEVEVEPRPEHVEVRIDAKRLKTVPDESPSQRDGDREDPTAKFDAVAQSAESPLHGDSLGVAAEALEQALSKVGGSLRVNRQESTNTQFELQVPTRTRLFDVLEVTIDVDTYALHAHLVQSIIPACVAQCDFDRQLVLHDEQTYEYVTLGLGKPIHEIDADDWGLIVLLVSRDQRLAIRVDDVDNIKKWVSKQASSFIELGHEASMDARVRVLLDFDEPLASPHVPQSQTPKGFQSHSVVLCDVPSSIERKFVGATRNLSVECYTAISVEALIQQIQERRPRVLVLHQLETNTDWLRSYEDVRGHVDRQYTQFVLVTPIESVDEHVQRLLPADMLLLHSTVSSSKLEEFLATTLGR